MGSYSAPQQTSNAPYFVQETIIEDICQIGYDPDVPQSLQDRPADQKAEIELLITFPLVEIEGKEPFNPTLLLKGNYKRDLSIGEVVGKGGMVTILDYLFKKFITGEVTWNDKALDLPVAEGKDEFGKTFLIMKEVPSPLLDAIRGKPALVLKYRAKRQSDGKVYFRMFPILASPNANYKKKLSGGYSDVSPKNWLIGQFQKKIHSAYPPYEYFAGDLEPAAEPEKQKEESVF